jgi:hypothetical protein
MHIRLRNGFPIVLIFGLWQGPTCRLSIAVLNELAVAAAYISVSITLLKASDYVHRRNASQVRARASLESSVSAT